MPWRQRRIWPPWLNSACAKAPSGMRAPLRWRPHRIWPGSSSSIWMRTSSRQRAKQPCAPVSATVFPCNRPGINACRAGHGAEPATGRHGRRSGRAWPLSPLLRSGPTAPGGATRTSCRRGTPRPPAPAPRARASARSPSLSPTLEAIPRDHARHYSAGERSVAIEKSPWGEA